MPELYALTGTSMNSPSSENSTIAVDPLLDVLAREPVERAVQPDVLAAGEVLAEARAELEQRHDAAAALGPPRVERHDPREAAQERRLPGAVAAHHPDRFAGRDVQVEVAQRVDAARRAAGRATRTSSFSVRARSCTSRNERVARSSTISPRASPLTAPPPGRAPSAGRRARRARARSRPAHGDVREVGDVGRVARPQDRPDRVDERRDRVAPLEQVADQLVVADAREVLDRAGTAA